MARPGPTTTAARNRNFARRALALSAALLLLLVAVAGRPDGAHAQERTVRERQIPVDSVHSIQEIGPELRRELGLFSDIEGFRVARLFELEDGRTVLEISLQQDGRLVRERRYLPPEVLESLRNHLAERLAEVDPDRKPADPDQEEPVPAGGDPPEEEADRRPEATPEDEAPRGAEDEDRGEEQAVSAFSQEGRGRLVLGQTLVGLGFYGWAVPELLDLEGERPIVAAYLLTAGLSFYLPYRLTRNIPVRDAHRHMVLWGSTRGILYGHLAAGIVTGDEDFGRNRGHLASSLAASVGASYLGYRAVEWGGLDEGTSVLWSTLADAGTLAGFGAAYVSGFYDDVVVEAPADDPLAGERRTMVESEQAHPRAADFTVLALTGAGLAAGRWLGTTDDHTVGDVSALRSAGLLGAQAALPLTELTVEADDDRGKRYAAGALVGGAAGLAAGSWILRGRSFSPSDGLLLNAGQLAGGLGALGLTWLLAPDGESDQLLYTTAAAVGSGVGLALTYRAMVGESEMESAEGGAPRERRRGDPGLRRGVRVELSPTALLSGLAPGIAGINPGERADPARFAPPLVRIRF